MLRNLIQEVQAITAEVIRQTGKDKPADAALREALKEGCRSFDTKQEENSRHARTLRIRYFGAIYHRLNCGDRCEPILRNDFDRRHFSRR